MNRSQVRDRGPVVVTCIAVCLMGLFFWLDGRPPRDPGLYWADVPRMWRALGGGRWDMLAEIGIRPGGWLVIAMAGLARLSRGPWIFELLSVGSVAAVVLSAGRLGARTGGPRGSEGARLGGWFGALLAAGMPLVVVQGRLPWIHLPEAALLGMLLVRLVEDPKLERRGAWLGAALLGAALASVRHSGLVWLLMTLPLLRGRVRLLVVPWLVGAVPSVLQLGPYMMAKAGARESYASRLPGLGTQALWLVGAFGIAAIVVGLVGRLRARRWDRTAWTGLGMVAVAGLMWALFRAGLDNFTPLVFGLVFLAAGGVGRLCTGLAGLGVFAVWSYTFAPGLPPDGRTLWRVWPAPEVRLIQTLLARTCAEGPCRVGVVSGLFMPDGEEPGHLELWTLKMDGVFLADLRHGTRMMAERPVDAVAQWDCEGPRADWLQRFPRSDDWQDWGRTRLDLQPSWMFRPDETCAFVWWTPEGRIADPAPSVGHAPAR